MSALLETAETNVKNELTRQELERKAEKQAKIDELIAEHGNGKNIDQESDWLNKSKSLKEIEIAIKNQVFRIEQQEEIHMQKVKQLETIAELIETKHKVEINELPYISMLAHLELDAVIGQMETDVANIIRKREAEKQRAEQQEKVEVVETPKVEIVEEIKEEKVLREFKLFLTETERQKLIAFIKKENFEVAK